MNQLNKTCQQESLAHGEKCRLESCQTGRKNVLHVTQQMSTNLYVKGVYI